MSFTIKIEPSGKTFTAEHNESLLEAALRSGLNVKYSCNTGSCGECKARIKQGNVETIRHFDFTFSEVEKLQNHALLCSVSAKSNLVIEASEAFGAKDIPIQNISVKVAKIERVGDDNIILHLRTPRSNTLRFLAGQFVKISVAGLGPENFYIASCPCNGMIIQIHVQRQSNNVLNEYIFSALQIGQNININGPYGEFTLDDDSKRPIVMIAQDVGFAPMKSLIEHAIALDLQQSIILFWLVEHGKSHYQSNYCRSWEDAFDSFVYRPLHIDSTPSGENDYESAMEYMLSRSPIESEIDLYIAGPGALAEIASKKFISKGTPLSRIHRINDY